MKPIITPEEMADRLDRDASTMDVGRPPVQCTRRKAANMIRQMSLDIAVLKGKGNVWQEAVDHQRVITHLGIANDIATQEEAHKALNEVITWHVNVAIDPAVNGGFSLQPVKPTPAAEPLPLLVRDIARDLGITTLDACQALKGLGNFSVNSAVTADMARKLRECFPEATEDSSAGDRAESTQDDEGISRGDWLAQAERLYLAVGDTLDEARMCASYLYNEQDWDGFGGDDPIHAALDDVEGRGPKAEVQAEPVADDYPHEQMDALALARYKVVPSDQIMYWRHAVVAGDGNQHLYNGSEVDCQNMARKFAGAFLDGAFTFHERHTAPQAQPADALDATKDTVWIPLDANTIQQFATGEFNGDWWLATKCYDSPIVGRYEWIQGRKPNGFNCGHTARLGVDEITHVAKYIQPEMPK